MIPAPILAVGITGQALFGLRTLLQWLSSERVRRSVLPAWYWPVSLAGSACVVTYALLRHDPVFLLSALPQSFVYARNLFIRRAAARARLAPQAAGLAAFLVWAVLARPALPEPFWAAVGFAGSLLWSGRFLVQWWISERVGSSVLPAQFWWMSLVGTAFMLAYAIHRVDPVMIAGYALGPIPYLRNLALLRRAEPPAVGHAPR
ncbi:MAG: lipid-A-disaccharide synthase N-terminal domain-containing protein [Planctomycetaceae bacterium]